MGGDPELMQLIADRDRAVDCAWDTEATLQKVLDMDSTFRSCGCTQQQCESGLTLQSADAGTSSTEVPAVNFEDARSHPQLSTAEVEARMLEVLRQLAKDRLRIRKIDSKIEARERELKIEARVTAAKNALVARIEDAELLLTMFEAQDADNERNRAKQAVLSPGRCASLEHQDTNTANIGVVTTFPKILVKHRMTRHRAMQTLEEEGESEIDSPGGSPRNPWHGPDFHCTPTV